jgi:hypothetical protein
MNSNIPFFPTRQNVEREQMAQVNNSKLFFRFLIKSTTMTFDYK